MTAVLRGNIAVMCAQVYSRYDGGLLKMYPGCHNVTYSDPGNDSGLPHYEQCEAYTSSMGRTGDYIVGTCLIFIIVPAIVMNSFVIWSFAVRHKTIVSVDYYILTLAINDLCSPVFAYPLAMISTFSHRWIFGQTGCVINGFLGFFFGIADIFVLSLLSFTRFLCVCCPMTFSRLTKCKVLLSLLAALSLAGFWALCPLVGWGVYGPEPFGTSCTLDWAAPDRSYVTCVFMVCLALPLTVMTVSYGSILHSTSAASRRLRRHGGDGRLRRARHEIRLIKITLLMSVCFLAAWTPYAVVSMASAYMEDLEVPGTVSIFPTLLAKTSHLSNPVVYFVMNSRFSRQRPWCSVPFVGSRMSSSSCSGRALQGDNVHLEYLRKARFVQQPVESVVGAGTLLVECTLVTSNAVSVQAESDVTSSPAASEESNGLSRRMESDQDHLSTDEHEKACCEAAVTTEREKDRAPSKDKDLARKRPRGKSRPKKEGCVSVKDNRICRSTSGKTIFKQKNSDQKKKKKDKPCNGASGKSRFQKNDTSAVQDETDLCVDTTEKKASEHSGDTPDTDTCNGISREKDSDNNGDPPGVEKDVSRSTSS